MKSKNEIRKEILEAFLCKNDNYDKMFDLLTDLNYDSLTEEQIKYFIEIMQKYIYEYE